MKYLFTLLISSIPIFIHAQCYTKFLAQGKSAYAQKDYAQAIERWEFAQRCSDKPASNDLVNLISNAKSAQTNANKSSNSSSNEDAAKRKQKQQNYEKRREAENDAWRLATEKEDADAYRSYLSKYPNGIFADIAKRKIEEYTIYTSQPPTINHQRPATNDQPSTNNYQSTTTNDIEQLDKEMILVEGSEFFMGSNAADRFQDEKPAHPVQLTDFWMSKFEVTQKQWQAVIKEFPRGFNANNFCANCPMTQVSWNEAQDFIKSLNMKTGKKYRLPTEAEWEYAAKGGKNSVGYDYSGGNELAGVSQYGTTKDTTVGSKIPNELGIFDMSGNVYEWCSDFYDEHYYTNSPNKNPTGAETGNMHIIRGGAWSSEPEDCQVTVRAREQPNAKDNKIGFRLVRQAQ
jgi:formylglycine-generating enzyme required for sulfatase activity